MRIARFLSTSLACSFLACAACSDSGGDAGASLTVTFNPAIYEGTWAGIWTNTTTSESDAVTFTVVRDGMQLLVEFDLDGEVFGVSDPDVEYYVAEIFPDRAELAPVVSPVYGELYGEVSDTAAIRVTGIDIGGGVDSFELVGTTDGSVMTANVTITYEGGGIATANSIMARS